MNLLLELSHQLTLLLSVLTLHCRFLVYVSAFLFLHDLLMLNVSIRYIILDPPPDAEFTHLV